MILFYNPSSKEWQHGAESEEPIRFGASNQLVPARPAGTQGDCCRFDIQVKGGRAGPLIGIMTAMNNKPALSGNGLLFHSLQKEIQQQKGIAIIFPPEKLSRNSVTGVLFDSEKNKWIKATAPLPDIVYNRVPFRKAETLPAFKDAVSYFEAMDIPFFNPSFLNKHTLYSIFQKHEELRNLMPETIRINSFADLALFIERHSGVYFKKASASQGSGIFRLRKEHGQYILSSHSRSDPFPTLEEFWDEAGQRFLRTEYIAQKEIRTLCMDGRRFDFRIHAHDSPDGYQITGIGIRQSRKQDVTTHVQKGGEIVPYEPLRTEKHDTFFSGIVKIIGKALSNDLGYFGEFSIDAGIDEQGNYVVFEVNSKPMSFNEPDIEKKRINALADLLITKAQATWKAKKDSGSPPILLSQSPI